MSNGFYTMRDTAFPNDSGPETDIMLIYVGGDTPHAWTDKDIASMDEKLFLPTWVRSDPASFNGASEAATFAAWLHSHKVPNGSTVCLDLEIAVDTAYVNSFNLGMRAAGFKTMKYGSRSFIFNNPKTDGGTFVADPTGNPHMVTIGDTVATQYAFDGQFDLSLVKKSVPLWGNKTNGGPPPLNWTEQMINTLPTIAIGSTGIYVKRAQALCNAVSVQCAMDGDFGPLTETAVKQVQSHFGLTQDGIVGQLTWTALIAR